MPRRASLFQRGSLPQSTARVHHVSRQPGTQLAAHCARAVAQTAHRVAWRGPPQFITQIAFTFDDFAALARLAVLRSSRKANLLLGFVANHMFRMSI
jgi:hypothetical protein